MKEGKQKGRLKEWLKTKGKDALGKGLDIFGELTGKEGIEKIGEALQSDPDLSEEEKAEAAELVKLELEAYRIDAEDRASARNLQIEALNQSDNFSKRFVYYMAAFWSVVGAVYLFLVTFTNVTNEAHANTIIGFLLGTIVATIINFFFGSSKGSKDKNELLKIK
jgi:hypothetical protein